MGAQVVCLRTVSAAFLCDVINEHVVVDPEESVTHFFNGSHALHLLLAL